MNPRASFLIIIALCLGLGLWWWLAQPENQPGAPRPGLPVAVSVYPLADFTARIGGEFVNVTTVVPGGVEPHDFEPSARAVTQILDTKVFIYVGAGFDHWAEDIGPDIVERGGRVIAVEDVVKLAEAEEHMQADDEHESEGLDPHVWLDPVLSQDIARAIRDALSAADPERASVYAANAQVLIESLQELDVTYATSLSECELNDIIVSHNAFGYLGARYGFNIHAIAGLSPQSEPSLNDLVELAAEAEDLGVSTIFFETLVSPALAETLAQEIGATTAVLNPLEGLTPAEAAQGENYFSLMDRNRQALSQALLCQ